MYTLSYDDDDAILTACFATYFCAGLLGLYDDYQEMNCFWLVTIYY
jgi:hypothetical protein